MSIYEALLDGLEVGHEVVVWLHGDNPAVLRPYLVEPWASATGSMTETAL